MPVPYATHSRAACIAAALMVWSGPLAAQDAGLRGRPETGAEWLARCGMLAVEAPDRADRQSTASCLAWVEGLIDINEIYRGLGALERSEEGFCMPPDATVGEAARQIARYFDDHRSALHFSARILAYMALRHGFPCGNP